MSLRSRTYGGDSSKKVAELRKKTGQEVSEIEFAPRETMKGLEGYHVKIKLL
ncbi:TPA: addiction module toxin, GnsA/GnsB family [Salmonella enterica]|nr:addiction module toxin, GnsA/GnsB family [Salmonella enterica subsp. enterica serovar Luckenwalde]HAU6777814.1 addiction module toxin, GnsA/GnsB family [Salmonella enterica subsp. enterica serovar Luckenwalde]HCL4953347.1 addiction module toxin, GnsA/GnsB family [Salmonella enterica]